MFVYLSGMRRFTQKAVIWHRSALLCISEVHNLTAHLTGSILYPRWRPKLRPKLRPSSNFTQNEGTAIAYYIILSHIIFPSRVSLGTSARFK